MFITGNLFAGSSIKFANLGDFPLENGQVIQACRIAYRTAGKLNADSSNVVIYPTWFSGKTSSLIGLSTAGKIVDSTRYFVVALAALGNGESSSPSNSKLQPGRKFPQFTIRDMVHSQRRALQKVFGFKKVHAIIGGSMGAMQGFEWLVQYPRFMERAVLYVATPKLASADLLRMGIEKMMITRQGANPAETWAQLHAITKLTAHTTGYLTAHTDPAQMDSLWQSWLGKEKEDYSLDDYLYQLRAMIGHDIFASFGSNQEKTAAIIKARTLLILSESDQIINPLPALEFGPRFGAEILLLQGNCGHLEPGCQMDLVSKRIDRFLRGQ